MRSKLLLLTVIAGFMTPVVAPAMEDRVFFVVFEPGSYTFKADDHGIMDHYAYYAASKAAGTTHGRIVIIGYADKGEGTPVELSRLRAITVADRLVEEGFPKEMIAVDWKGGWERATPFDNSEPRHNRRVEISPMFWNPAEDGPPHF